MNAVGHIARSLTVPALALVLVGCSASGPWLGNYTLPDLYTSGDRYVPDAPGSMTWKSPTDDRAGENADTWAPRPCHPRAMYRLIAGPPGPAGPPGIAGPVGAAG